MCSAVQTETSMTSATGSSGSEGHFSPEGQLNGGFQKQLIKEEPEDEDYHGKEKGKITLL